MKRSARSGPDGAALAVRGAWPDPGDDLALATPESVYRDAEIRLGRALTAGERAIDIVRIDAALARAKEDLRRAIDRERARLVLAWARGGTDRIAVTHEMVEVLDRLRAEGRRIALAELRRLGVKPRRVSFPGRPPRAGRAYADDDMPWAPPRVLAWLRAMLPLAEARIAAAAPLTATGYGGYGIEVLIREPLPGQRGAPGMGPSPDVVAAAAIARAVDRIPGALDVAGRVISGALAEGVADIYEAHADLFDCWQYSAIMDNATCEVCASEDGQRFTSLSLAYRVMPNFGPNPNCYGDGRCRCRLVPCGPTGRQVAPPPTLTRPVDDGSLTDMERRLGDGEIDWDSAERPSVASANEVWFADHSGVGRVVVKPSEEVGVWRSLRRHITPGFDAEREHASWLVAKALNRTGRFSIRVPEHMIQTLPVPGHDYPVKCGVQRMLTNAEMLWDAGIDYSGLTEDDLFELAIFDTVIGNSDRHVGNAMIDVDGVWAIDNGLTFPERDNRYDGGNFGATQAADDLFAPDEIVGMLAENGMAEALVSLMEDEALLAALNDLLPAGAVDEMHERIRQLVEAGTLFVA